MSILPRMTPEREGRLDEAVASFLRAESSGGSADPGDWLRRYPDLAGELAEFFDEHLRVRQLALRPHSAGQAGADSAPGQIEFEIVSPAETVDFPGSAPRQVQDRYHLLQFHARGGMGEVWLAHDARVGRRVAVKRLRPERESLASRFVLEAAITGQLEHPSIIPLHDLGHDQDGKPFYVMKFVEGRSLKSAIAEHHAGRDPAASSSVVEFRRLLEVFVDVCRAIAYAHSRGVLHRDIKPDNIMLGAFGETMILDFGLAKSVEAADVVPGRSASVLEEESTDTCEGAVMGSPSYMSPESAQGRPEWIDERSDVYLLGATLYEILTGKPPREGRSHLELVDLARTSLPPPPRKLAPHIPRAVEAVCMKAMAYTKEDRYRSSAALAEDIERFLADEPTVAFREPWILRAWRWARRHQVALNRAAAASITAALILVSFLKYQEAQALKFREQVRGQLPQFYRLAEEAQFYAANNDAISERFPYYDANRAREAARDALLIADTLLLKRPEFFLPDERSALDEQLARLLRLTARLDLANETDRGGLQSALALLDRVSLHSPPTQGDFQIRARLLERLLDSAGALDSSRRASDPRTIVSAEDHFLAGEFLRLTSGSAVSDTGDSTGNGSAATLVQAVAEFRRAVDHDPKHYWARFQLGRCSVGLGRYDDAIAAFDACIALRPSSPWAYSARGMTLAVAGRFAEARHDLLKAHEIDSSFRPAAMNQAVLTWLERGPDASIPEFDALLQSDPHLAEAAFYRGQALLQCGSSSQALADLNTAARERPAFRATYVLRALVHFQLGDDSAGFSDLHLYLALASREPFDPKNSAGLRGISRLVRRLASNLPPDAMARVARKLIGEVRSALEQDQTNAELWDEVGGLEQLRGNASAAIDAYSRALELRPSNVRLRNQRGWAYAATQDLARAMSDFKEAIKQAPRDGEAYSGCGFVRALEGRAREARIEAAAALLYGSDHYLVLHNVACIYATLSTCEPQQALEYENLALALLQRAVELSRHSPLGPDEMTLIRSESAFPATLKARPEFDRLLSGLRL